MAPVKGKPTFDASKLQPGDWLSEVNYYKVHDTSNPTDCVVTAVMEPDNYFMCEKFVLEE